MRPTVLIVAALSALAAGAYADGAGVVAAEVGCGYAGGVAAAMAGIVVGNVVAYDEEFAGGGFYGLFLAYPAGAGLGSWGAGEIWGDDSAHDWLTAAASVGASYAACFTGLLVGDGKGLFIGMLAAPVASTVAYNLVKRAGDDEEPADESFYVAAGFAF